MKCRLFEKCCGERIVPSEGKWECWRTANWHFVQKAFEFEEVRKGKFLSVSIHLNHSKIFVGKKPDGKSEQSPLINLSQDCHNQ